MLCKISADNGRDYSCDLSQTDKIRLVVLEITSKCNLRCTFCAKSIPGNEDLPGRDEPMSDEVFARVVGFLERHQPDSISFVGVGEPTFRKNWMDVVGALRAKVAAPFHLNTNLSLAYSNAEIDLLSRFSALTVSIESADPAIQKKLRRASDLKVVIHNIMRIRACAEADGRRPPVMNANCTVSDQNVDGVRALAALVKSMGLSRLDLSSLFKFDELDQQQPIDDIGVERLDRLREDIAFIASHMASDTFQLNVQPRLFAILNGVHENVELSAGMTRLCAMPWELYTFGANGDVFPCCVGVERFSTIASSNEDLVNGDAIRAWRTGLLTGDLPNVCKNCSNAPVGTRDQLMRMIVPRTRNTLAELPAPNPFTSAAE